MHPCGWDSDAGANYITYIRQNTSVLGTTITTLHIQIKILTLRIISIAAIVLLSSKVELVTLSKQWIVN